MDGIILSAAAPALVLVGTFVQARYSRRTGRESNSTADWSAFVAEQRAVNETQRGEIGKLNDRVSTLEAEVSKERDLRERILAYARSLYWAWKRQFPEDQPPEAPESIRNYFD